MQRSNRNILPATLMVASLLLLAAFQAFWLRQEYAEQRDLLLREANLLFANTVQALEDSVIQQKVAVSFQGEKTDKVVWKRSTKQGSLQADTLVFFQSHTAPGQDEAGNSIRDSEQVSNIEIRIMGTSAEGDSLKQMISRVLRPVQRRINLHKKSPDVNGGVPGPPPLQHDRFLVRLGNDTLPIKNLEAAYAQRLQKAGINLSFTVRRTPEARGNQAPGPPPALPAPGLRSIISRYSAVFTAALRTLPVPSSMPMDSRYSAIFTGHQGFLFRKIIPQLLFSVFLLAVTSLAFAVIHLNLQRQRRLIQLKNDFISNVTHELKTPIATVGVALEALQSFDVDRNPEQTREYLDISRKELDRLSMLVDKVLKMALFEQQDLALTPERLDADQLVRQVLSTMKPQLEKYGALCTYEPHGDNFTLLADRVHLTNVLYNLLDNALKYSEGTPTVSIRLSTTDEQLRLEVLDKGIGIPAEYRHRIFEKFFRVPSGNIHNVKGYGLGLSYVASVVKAHQGRIEVESEPQQGSRFTLLLPRGLHQPINNNTTSTHDTHQTTVR
ncbi:sensor histidine kinase KdpD [Telluribacter sp. SYSU D00476]|uniref:sensor histidine kinase n=1 Tax=Telluribacter sp. SYSU D00476 TaxID=2811430 RepID=UPI001FF18751|nr:HAMP domain-containing sensor histidine kinase [Telluribacter sp. SYSU D00476]